MAKKENNMISINQLDKYCKSEGISNDFIELKFDIDVGEYITFKVKPRLTTEELMKFIDNTVSIVFVQDEYHPELLQLAIFSSELTYFVQNCKDLNLQKTEQLYYLTELNERIEEKIDKKQLSIIKSSIIEKIALLNSVNQAYSLAALTALEREIDEKNNEAMYRLNDITDVLSKITNGLDGVDVKKLINDIDTISNKDEGLLAQKIVEINNLEKTKN